MAWQSETLQSFKLQTPNFDKKGSPEKVLQRSLLYFFKAVTMDQNKKPPVPFGANMMEGLPPVKLTHMQMVCLKYVDAGLTAHEIGEQLCLSRRTIEFHMAKVRLALSAKNYGQCIRRADELGIPFRLELDPQ